MLSDQRLTRTPPKKLLALDGGGIRGLITLEILGKIEDLLQEAAGRGPEFVLADFFDYIGGTSTGAVIAAALSQGMRVEDVRDFYMSHGPAMFDKAGWMRRFNFKYEDERLAASLRGVFGPDTRLGSGRLRTLLLLVLRNATTNSPWFVSNIPFAKYNNPNRPDANLNLPLWQLVRASIATPVYFPPEVLQMGRSSFVFQDGGVTVFNNPALQLFLMATLDEYHLGWPTGEDKMLLVSVGTGSDAGANANLAPGDLNPLFNATAIPSALMYAASVQQDMLCRVLGRCRSGDYLDREIGDLKESKGPVDQRLFTYLRYDVDLSSGGLADLGLEDIRPEDVQSIDSIDFMSELRHVGSKAAQRRIQPTHFQGFA